MPAAVKGMSVQVIHVIVVDHEKHACFITVSIRLGGGHEAVGATNGCGEGARRGIIALASVGHYLIKDKGRPRVGQVLVMSEACVEAHLCVVAGSNCNK